jgi:hypothetical protein
MVLSSVSIELGRFSSFTEPPVNIIESGQVELHRVRQIPTITPPA